ncbi:MAG: response regulator [Anaerolineales bacterium]|nr:response regulator [Anaerolineales bacterium]
MAKIIIAEDERDIRNLVAFTLQFAGHQVIATADGAEALEAARRDMPDLIALDIRLPRMSGYEAFEACEQIKFETYPSRFPDR